LIERTSQNPITLSGDIAWVGNDYAYDMIASLLEIYKIPWAPVWGNHDNQGGAEYMDKIATRYMTNPYCVYEKGDAAIGNGNYVTSHSDIRLPSSLGRGVQVEHRPQKHPST
jgi:hypothetical protein